MRLFAGQAEYIIKSSELICGVVKIRPARQGSTIAQYTKFTSQTIHNKQIGILLTYTIYSGAIIK